MALTERIIHLFSQLVYLDALPDSGRQLTVGMLADYYRGNPVGQLYLSTRFGDVPRDYTLWLDFLDSGVDEVRDYRIVYILDDNTARRSGFYACSYLAPAGELVAAFRGSEMLGNRLYQNDYRMNFSMAYAEKPAQQAMVDTYFATFPEISARLFYLTGHSLGGHLAAYGAITCPRPDRLLGCYSFNAPGFNGLFIESNRMRTQRIAPQLHLLQNQHDIVSSLLISPVEPVILASAFRPLEQPELTMADLLYAHSNFMFVPEGEGFALSPDGQKDRLCELVHQFSLLFLRLPTLVKKAVSKLILEIVYSAQPAEKQVNYLLEQLIKLYIRHDVAGSGEDGLAAASSAYLAHQMWQTPKSGTQLYQELQQKAPDDPTSVAAAGILLFRLLQFASSGRRRDSMAAPPQPYIGQSPGLSLL